MPTYKERNAFLNFISTKGIKHNELVNVWNKSFSANCKSIWEVYNNAESWAMFHTWVYTKQKEGELTNSGISFSDLNGWRDAKKKDADFKSKAQIEYSALNIHARTALNMLKVKDMNPSQIKSFLCNIIGCNVPKNAEGVSVAGKLKPVLDLVGAGTIDLIHKSLTNQ